MGGDTETISTSQITSELLSDYFGNTYGQSPYFVSFNQEHHMMEVSYSEKYVPFGVFNLMENYPNSIDKVFVRFIDEMADNDLFFDLPSSITKDNITANTKNCIYLFDEIIFSNFVGLTEMVGSVNEVSSTVSSIKIEGDFQIRTTIPIMFKNGINSYFDEISDKFSNYSLEMMQSKEKDVIELILKHSDNITFKYKGIKVHKIFKTSEIDAIKDDELRPNIWLANKNHDGKMNINSCGWYNCGNIEFLAYLIERRQQIDGYKRQN
jgi:hypothetical protein